VKLQQKERRSGWRTVQFQSRYFRKGGKHLIFESKVITEGRVSKTSLKIGFIRAPLGVPNKVLYADAPPRSPTRLYPFLYHFWQKTYPFRIPSIAKWNVFHIPTFELCIPYNNCKYTIFKMWIIQDNRTFSRLFHSHKMCLLNLMGVFTYPNNRHIQISQPFHVLQLVKFLPFHLETWKIKSNPFGRSLPI